MAAKVSAKRRPSGNVPSEGVTSAKKVSFALYTVYIYHMRVLLLDTLACPIAV